MSYLIRLCLILLFGIYCEAEKPSEKEAFMTTSSIIRAAGYPVQRHRVTTSDGYILIQHRIPGGRLSANQTGELNAKRKKAILILHGLGGCSSNFVILGPKRSLGYFLADAGYDVWLANLRGTLHSTHVNLTKTDKEFWNFSFHEHGEYDVPAVIDYILNVTGLEKIMLVGHSLGTTNFFATMALRPEYNDKLIAFVGLAPAMYLDHLKDITDLTLNTLQLSNAAKGIGWVAIMPNIIHVLQENLCIKNRPTIDLCTILVEALFGDDSEQHDGEMAPVYLWRIQPFPFGSLEHYGKIALTGEFTKFTGGVHGPVEPYNTSNIRIPVSLLYGENDRLIDKTDTVRLEKELARYTVLEEIGPPTWRQFNHIDFIFAKDVATLLNRPLVKHIDKLYNKYNSV